MSSSDILENFKEMIELIPSIQKAVKIGIERDLKAHTHDMKRLKVERKFLRDGLSLLQKKWIIDILYIMQFLKKPHYNDIKRSLPEINSKTLTDRLRFLENKKVLIRTVKTDRPIRVTYEFSEFGEGLFKLLLPFIYYFVILPKNYLKKIR